MARPSLDLREQALAGARALGYAALLLLLGAAFGSSTGRPAGHQRSQPPRRHRVAAASYRTFYIDYSRGSDGNRGTSRSRPWKLAPGMAGFSGAYRPEPGDHFVFRGGVTWPASAFPLKATASGMPGKDDVYGADQAWHVGASYSPPMFAGPAPMFIDLRGEDYITVSGISVTGWTAQNLSTYGSCAVVDINSEGLRPASDQHIIINGLTVTHFSIDQASDANAGCAIVLAYTGPPYAGSSVVEHSRFIGSGNSFGEAISCVGNVLDNTISHMVGMVYPCGHGTVSGNFLSGCGYPSFPTGSYGDHADAIQTDAANGVFSIHDNVIDGTGLDGSGDECESLLVGNPGETDYIYNNVFANIQGNAINLTQASSPGTAAYVWNNTIGGGGLGTTWCVRAGHPGEWAKILIQNNLCVTQVAGGTQGVDTTADGDGVSAATLAIDHNLVVTPRSASARGLGPSQRYAYAPVTRRSPTVGKGVNLSAQCTRAVMLCRDTTYAGQRTPTARPATGSWDVGAYELTAGG